ncbi:hypothetical protein NEDG_01236 [Nematocida displodere]|uniref:SLC26A/SulP transporter domain-containing protein n=1 Tax=Nematocida displodere TaxID=1805483 RepID=A0A177EAX9_9MICR|nr:hypothetical protein NEDG_01236 [Nematocida displodere]
MQLYTSGRDAPVASQTTATVSRIVYKGLIVAFGVVLYFMYILTVGERMFPAKEMFGGSDARYLSTLLFVAGTCLSQMVFFALSAFTSGVMSSPISEAFFSTRALGASLGKSLPPEEVLPTMLASLFLAALLTSAVFFALFALRAEKALQKIPSSVSQALFVVIGFLCIVFANERVGGLSIGVPPWAVYAVFNALGVVLCVAAHCLKKMGLVVGKYSILFIAGGLSLAFYLAKLVGGASFASLTAQGWFASDPSAPAALVLPRIEGFGGVNVAAVCAHLPNILGIVVVNALQFPINFPPTSKALGQTPSARKELLANAVANAATSLVGASAGALPTATIALHGAGSESRGDTLAIAVGLCVAFWGGYRYTLYIPFVVFDTLLLVLGTGIVLRTFLGVFKTKPQTIPFILSVVLVSGLTQSLVCGLLAAAVFHCCGHGLSRVRAWRRLVARCLNHKE